MKHDLPIRQPDYGLGILDSSPLYPPAFLESLAEDFDLPKAQLDRLKNFLDQSVSQYLSALEREQKTKHGSEVRSELTSVEDAARSLAKEIESLSLQARRQFDITQTTLTATEFSEIQQRGTFPLVKDEKEIEYFGDTSVYAAIALWVAHTSGKAQERFPSQKPRGRKRRYPLEMWLLHISHFWVNYLDRKVTVDQHIKGGHGEFYLFSKKLLERFQPEEVTHLPALVRKIRDGKL